MTTGQSYNSLFDPAGGTGADVDTLNPAGSILYKRMTGNPTPMPPSGILPSTETDKVLKWIQEGAKNN